MIAVSNATNSAGRLIGLIYYAELKCYRNAKLKHYFIIHVLSSTVMQKSEIECEQCAFHVQFARWADLSCIEWAIVRTVALVYWIPVQCERDTARASSHIYSI